MQTGPVQLVVFELDNAEDPEEITAELYRLRERELVGFVDVLMVTKDGAGNVVAGSRAEGGTAVASLIGLGPAGDEPLRVGTLAGACPPPEGTRYDPAEVWYVTEAIPPGTSAAIALIEHRWAIPLCDAVASTGAQVIVDAWVHPEDLVLVGEVLSLSSASKPVECP